MLNLLMEDARFGIGSILNALLAQTTGSLISTDSVFLLVIFAEPSTPMVFVPPATKATMLSTDPVRYLGNKTLPLFPIMPARSGTGLPATVRLALKDGSWPRSAFVFRSQISAILTPKKPGFAAAAMAVMTLLMESVHTLLRIMRLLLMLDARDGVTVFVRNAATSGCSIPMELVFLSRISARRTIQPLEIVIAAMVAMT